MYTGSSDTRNKLEDVECAYTGYKFGFPGTYSISNIILGTYTATEEADQPANQLDPSLTYTITSSTCTLSMALHQPSFNEISDFPVLGLSAGHG